MEPLIDAIARPSGDTGTPPSVHDDQGSSHHAQSSQSARIMTTEVKDTKSIINKAIDIAKHPDISPLQTQSLPGERRLDDALCDNLESEKRSLNLLDLPVDILKDIVKGVTHTNDLASLALCHSALHRLVTPLIYSRFDIVWPDGTTTSEPRVGVDALTYGLATLVMAEDVFGEAAWQRDRQEARDRAGGSSQNPNRQTGSKMSDIQIRRRRGNYYANFIRKFSLGNGPPEWVQEYLINKEGGKMLGTLVALAIARMRSLETFVWDMPTGILRDVWAALSYLGDRQDGEQCRLERVWVRFHDNAAVGHVNHTPPQGLNTNATSGYTLDHVERPSFSILPPLKSLSVLDIDELQYLDEMSVSIGRSLNILKELRVGISRLADEAEWLTSWDVEGAEQIDPYVPAQSYATIGGKRLGGVLGVLTGSFYDMREKRAMTFRPKRLRRRSSNINLNQSSVNLQNAETATAIDNPPTAASLPTGVLEVGEATAVIVENQYLRTDTLQSKIGERSGENGPLPWKQGVDVNNDANDRKATSLMSTEELPSTPVYPTTASPHCPTSDHEPVVDQTETKACSGGQLRLDSLELERVPLCPIDILENAIDWTVLTNLTLLSCSNHEQLWRLLRSKHTPQDRNSDYRQKTFSSAYRTSEGQSSVSTPIFTLHLKKIHTNNVSSALMSLIRECLAPNTLESVYLQDTRSYVSSVEVGSIFRNVIKRHRTSLRKVLVDSSENASDSRIISSSRWKKWVFGQDMISFITSGRMPALRELGMSIDKADWHYFLQRLPMIPHLRALYLPYIAQLHGLAGVGAPALATTLEPRELALQVVDIIVLKPEIELCYIGLADKCFEIQEDRQGDGAQSDRHIDMPMSDEDVDYEEEDDEDVRDDHEDDDADSDQMLSDNEGSDSDDDFSAGTSDGMRLRLRGILFYDDKVSIFKARHGRL